MALINPIRYNIQHLFPTFVPQIKNIRTMTFDTIPISELIQHHTSAEAAYMKNGQVLVTPVNGMELFSLPVRLSATTIMVCTKGQIRCSINLKEYIIGRERPVSMPLKRHNTNSSRRRCRRLCPAAVVRLPRRVANRVETSNEHLYERATQCRHPSAPRRDKRIKALLFDATEISA